MNKSLVVFSLLLSSCAQQVHEDQAQPEPTVLQEPAGEENSPTAQHPKDTTVTVLWRENIFDSALGDSVNTIVLKDSYFKALSDPERAAIVYVSTFIGSECDWDGEANKDMSNLSCKIIQALGLGYQCSDRHKSLLKRWFMESPAILAKLEACPVVPLTATSQTTFNQLALATKDDMIKVNYEASGVNMREETFWDWSEELIFEVKDAKLELVSQKRINKS